MDPILGLDYAGIAVFAATGALAASRRQLDIVGFVFMAAITGIGGGTLRDLVLGVPVFWIANHNYLIVCAAVAVLVFFTAHLLESRYRVLLWLDAVGLAAYCVFGAYKGLVVSGSPVIAVVMGVLTATFGGIARDVVASEPSVIMRQEIYITAALAGALVYVLAIALGTPEAIGAAIAFLVAFIVRGGALRFGWTVPGYRSRPGRDPKDITGV